MTDTGTFRKKRPTLRTIADYTGLALTTVSRALKDGDDISENTKERVREAARKLGYRPNRAGVRLRTGKTNVIALVLSTEEQAMQRTAQLVSSVAGALRSTPYHLNITPYFPSEDVMEPIRYLVETESADGVIINQTRPNDPRVQYLIENEFPFASHGRTDSRTPHAFVDYDVSAFAEKAVEMLATRHRSRLALLAPPDEFTYRRFMTGSFSSTAERLGLENEILPDATGYDDLDHIEAHIVRHFSRKTGRPDGLVASTMGAAMAAAAAFDSLGLVLARDVDMVAREPVRILKRFRREIIVADDDLGEIGRLLAAALIARIERPEQSPQQILIAPQFTE